MLPPIPRLDEYAVSPTKGFLPEALPLTRLPDPYYNKWEAIAANLQALILSKRIRGVVDRLPVLDTIGLEHDAEWRRAYSLLIFMAHGYIWAGDRPSARLPPPVAVPLLKVAEYLEVPPVATYAGLCLWNFKLLFVDEGMDTLENLATLNTFTGALDESWFYLVSVAIEARGAPMIPLMLNAVQSVRHNDVTAVTRSLQIFAERLDDLVALLNRTYENCDPTIFYHRIRPFLAGSKNMAEAGLPNGVIYEDGSGTETCRQYSGGSNAQSSIIQFFDMILGVEHFPTGEKAPSLEGSGVCAHVPASAHNFLLEMRCYMPGPHARFLGAVQSVANIRPFVQNQQHNRPLALAYDACLSALRALRDAHIAIVTRYIVIPSCEVRVRSRSRDAEVVRKTNLATASRRLAIDAFSSPSCSSPSSSPSSSSKKQLKGTGGTALMAFLKQARDETSEAAAEEWAKRFMTRQARIVGTVDFFAGKEAAEPGADLSVQAEKLEVKGLAGTWTVEDEMGGICSF